MESNSGLRPPFDAPIPPHITYPCSESDLSVELIDVMLMPMWTFRVFDIVYVMTGGGPANKTMVVAYYAYLENFKFYHFGTGAAMSWIITLVILIASIVYLRVIQQKD